MSNICESDGSCADELPQTPEPEDYPRDSDVLSSLHDDTDTVVREISPTEEYSADLDNPNEVEDSEGSGNENGEESDVEEGRIGKVFLNAEESVDGRSDDSDICEQAKHIRSESPKVEPAVSSRLAGSEALEMGKTQPVLEDVNVSAIDGMTKGFSLANDEGKVLDETFDELILKDSESGEPFTCSHECGPNQELGEFKEASVQTTPDKLFINNDSCPMCKLQKDGVHDLKALCLECPPYKKRKLSDSDNATESISDHCYDIGYETYDENEEHILQRKTVSPQDQVVPDCSLETEIVKGAISSCTTSSIRSIRIGLSKRAKPRPLHQITKFQETDPAETDS